MILPCLHIPLPSSLTLEHHFCCIVRFVCTQSSDQQLHHRSMPSIKCLVVGDGTVGKTSLLYSYASHEFQPDYAPTIFDNVSLTVHVDGQDVQLDLWDTAGQEEFDRLRQMSYPDTDIFLICFSLMSLSSFENVRQRWYPEVRQHCPHAKIVLVGTKSDQRERPDMVQELNAKGQRPVSTNEAQRLAKLIDAVKYLECSALNRQGIDEIFQHATRAILTPQTKQRQGGYCPMCISSRGSCIIL